MKNTVRNYNHKKNKKNKQTNKQNESKTKN